jgi:hypothetical protein
VTAPTSLSIATTNCQQHTYKKDGIGTCHTPISHSFDHHHPGTSPSKFEGICDTLQYHQCVDLDIIIHPRACLNFMSHRNRLADIESCNLQ